MTIKSILRPLVAPLRNRWRARHPDLPIDEASFAGFRDPLMIRVAKTRFYSHADQQNIRGWMQPRERQILYGMGRWLPGPILEIGSWLGLSTTAIARGIRDSGTAKQFDTIDLKLTPENFRPVDGGIGLFLAGDSVTHGICSEQSYRQDILPFISAPGGSQQILKNNLERLGLGKLVTTHIGDFRSWQGHPCGWIFCDAMHDLHEIKVNAPHLKTLLTPGSLVACHDVGNTPELIAALRQELPLGHGAAVDSLYIAEIV